MTQSMRKKLFQTIEKNDLLALQAILAQYPDALETTGEHNRFTRDKTPLMYALQCRQLELGHWLMGHGADVRARMTGGPMSTVIELACEWASVISEDAAYEQWLVLIAELLQRGANPSEGLYPVLHLWGRVQARTDLISLLLAHGADVGHRLGGGMTIRERVQINAHCYSVQVLALLNPPTAVSE